MSSATAAVLSLACTAGCIGCLVDLHVALLVVLAIARVAIGWFPTDLIESPERTSRGRIHVLLAAVAFITLPWAAVALSRADHGEPWLGRLMVALAVLTAVALGTPLGPWFGLIERAFYVAMLTWLVLVAVLVL